MSYELRAHTTPVSWRSNNSGFSRKWSILLVYKTNSSRCKRSGGHCFMKRAERRGMSNNHTCCKLVPTTAGQLSLFDRHTDTRRLFFLSTTSQNATTRVNSRSHPAQTDHTAERPLLARKSLLPPSICNNFLQLQVVDCRYSCLPFIGEGSEEQPHGATERRLHRNSQVFHVVALDYLFA